MSWVKIDDGLPNNRKWKRLMRRCPEASALWVSALCWAASNLTDGRIDADDLEDVVPVRRPQKLAEALVEVGLWERDGDNYRIHDYLVHNPSAAEVLARREEDRQRKAAQRQKGRRNTDRGEDGQFVPKGVPPGQAEGHRPDDPGDDPPESQGVSPATRPVPSDRTILSSTSDSRSPQVEPVREEGDQPKNRRSEAVCAAAFAWLARYDLERVNGNGKVRNPDAWLTQAAQNRRSRHQADADRLIAEHPEWTPEQLAKAVAARDGNGAPGESTVAAAWELAKRNEAERCPIHGRLEPDEPVPDCERCHAVVGATT